MLGGVFINVHLEMWLISRSGYSSLWHEKFFIDELYNSVDLACD